MEENYITILIQSLEKKVKVLDAISDENKKQKQVLQEDSLDMDAFQATVDRKAELIEQTAFLDDGFEQMYERVKGILEEKKQFYAGEIETLKQLITEITERTVMIQKEELENRGLAESQFNGEKRKVRQMKTTKQVAAKYYNNMTKMNYVNPQFMDKKK